jgi:hypothetical protein
LAVNNPISEMTDPLNAAIKSQRLHQDEDLRRARSLHLNDEAARLRSQVKRSRRLAENVTSDKDQAMLKRVARDFDEAADDLENRNG